MKSDISRLDPLILKTIIPPLPSRRGEYGG